MKFFTQTLRAALQMQVVEVLSAVSIIVAGIRLLCPSATTLKVLREIKL
jgi:hypothetical protein